MDLIGRHDNINGVAVLVKGAFKVGSEAFPAMANNIEIAAKAKSANGEIMKGNYWMLRPYLKQFYPPSVFAWVYSQVQDNINRKLHGVRAVDKAPLPVTMPSQRMFMLPTYIQAQVANKKITYYAVLQLPAQSSARPSEAKLIADLQYLSSHPDLTGVSGFAAMEWSQQEVTTAPPDWNWQMYEGLNVVPVAKTNVPWYQFLLNIFG